MEALPLRAGRANCMSNIQQDMIEQTLAILASMMQQAAQVALQSGSVRQRSLLSTRRGPSIRQPLNRRSYWFCWVRGARVGLGFLVGGHRVRGVCGRELLHLRHLKRVSYTQHCQQRQDNL